MNHPDISIALCTFNRAALVSRALEALLNQRTDDKFTYDIVVLDDQSPDNTADVVQAIAAESPVPIHYVLGDGLGVAVARNTCVAHATGTWIAFTDDDQLNEPNWLLALYEAAFQSGADCVGGIVKLQLDEAPKYPLTQQTRGILGYKMVPEGWAETRQALPGTGNAMLKRSVFDDLNGFDNTLEWGGEDDDFMHRLLGKGYTVWFEPRAIVSHIIPPHRTTLEFYERASLRVGVAFAEVDYRLKGRKAIALRAVARILKAALLHQPCYRLAMLSKYEHFAIEELCYVWRARSYARQTLRILFPNRFPQDDFFNTLKFRKERTQESKGPA